MRPFDLLPWRLLRGQIYDAQIKDLQNENAVLQARLAGEDEETIVNLSNVKASMGANLEDLESDEDEMLNRCKPIIAGDFFGGLSSVSSQSGIGSAVNLSSVAAGAAS